MPVPPASQQRITLRMKIPETTMMPNPEHHTIPDDHRTNQRVGFRGSERTHAGPCREIEVLLGYLIITHANRTIASRSAALSVSSASPSHRRASCTYPAVGFNSGTRSPQ